MEADEAFRQLRLFEVYKEAGDAAIVLIAIATSWWLARKTRRSSNQWPTLIVISTMSIFGMTGCIRPYDTPEYAEIDTSETGFLIPLEGNSGNQAKFQSEEYLRELKVAAKRVQITHRWSQEGRLRNSGRWIPTVRLIKVNRSPVTREWTADATTGTAAKNQAIWIESSDSVGFSMGFTCTSFIPEEQAAKFLYWYPTGSLSNVMDAEVRGRIQQVAAEIAAKYPLDALRARKQEISDAVKNDITSFFAQRGIVITTVGMFGGMTYENVEIQRAIDNTVIAQQLKVVNEAKFEAQQRDNDRVTLEANAIAERARRIASGEADAKKIAAQAEAQSIREVNKALAEAQQNPLLYQLRSLEVERARVEHWNGQYPGYLLQMGTASPNLMLQLPTEPR
jgi:SPFH domain / Band 7 family